MNQMIEFGYVIQKELVKVAEEHQNKMMETNKKTKKKTEENDVKI